jgi:hypothetical protein
MSAGAACGDTPTSNKPLEWAGRRRVCLDSNNFLLATQGQHQDELVNQEKLQRNLDGSEVSIRLDSSSELDGLRA